MAVSRAHLFISGRVQGVNFRYYTRQEALTKGVKGWVRNLWDGRVEAVFQGEELTVRDLVDWCHTGPPSARVDKVEVQWETPSGDCEDFDVRMTGGGRLRYGSTEDR